VKARRDFFCLDASTSGILRQNAARLFVGIAG
jgi:hypothetical protein